MAKAPEQMIVMHPLPRVNEIATDVDADPRAVYFEQAAGGVPVRMALMAALLDMAPGRERHRSLGLGAAVTSGCGDTRHEADEEPAYMVAEGGRICTYAKCITTTEVYLQAAYTVDEVGEKRCWYCEQVM
jgi:aspartate carbamoyltransferase catalytic subunit